MSLFFFLNIFGGGFFFFGGFVVWVFFKLRKARSAEAGLGFFLVF